MGSEEEPVKLSRTLRLVYFIAGSIDKHVDWFKNKVVKPNQEKSYWYHEKIRRVPTVDQCYEDDAVCIYEANEQYLRDRAVDKNILHILQRRYQMCTVEKNYKLEDCKDLYEYYDNAVTNYFIKYGDLGMFHSATMCLMKQKHRMAWERRHGPVGSGRKNIEEE